MSEAFDGRRFVRELPALLAKQEGERVVLGAPMPGFFRNAPRPGELLAEGGVLGELEVLGVLYRLIVPAGVRGVVERAGDGKRLARRPVAYREALVVLDTRASIMGAESVTAASASHARGSALAFRAPMSGRYYAKSAPDADPFVRVGDVVRVGQTVALLEVMKTFNRVQYGGAALPESARVTAILPRDGDDVNAGDVLIEIEPA